MRDYQFYIKDELVAEALLAETPSKGQYLDFLGKPYVVSDVHLGELAPRENSYLLTGSTKVQLTVVIGYKPIGIREKQ